MHSPDPSFYHLVLSLDESEFPKNFLDLVTQYEQENHPETTEEYTVTDTLHEVEVPDWRVCIWRCLQGYNKSQFTHLPGDLASRLTGPGLNGPMKKSQGQRMCEFISYDEVDHWPCLEDITDISKAHEVSKYIWMYRPRLARKYLRLLYKLVDYYQ